MLLRFSHYVGAAVKLLPQHNNAGVEFLTYLKGKTRGQKSLCPTHSGSY
jgi:hypothetical protein